MASRRRTLRLEPAAVTMRSMRFPTLLLAAVATFLAGSGAGSAQTAVLMATVIDERTGETVTGLDADAFSVTDGDTPLRVVSATEPRGPFDLLVVFDSSMVGEAVRPVAQALVEELRDNESMALVAYHDNADLLQDFTSDRQLLRKALDRTEYGNLPRALDALFAAIDGGFAGSGNRRAIVLLSAGMIARGRTPEAEILDLARSRRVAVHSVFVRNAARSVLRRLALRTGGGSFAGRRLGLAPRELAKRVLDAVRSPYQLAVTGVSTLGNRIEASVANPAAPKTKLTVSILPVD